MDALQALAIDHATSGPRLDGRNSRRHCSRDRILLNCRLLMQTGTFRPSMTEVAKHARVSIRTAFSVFGSVDALLAAALDEQTTRAVLALILRDSLFPATQADCDRLVRAVIHGRC